jgi:hypothetical protein
LPKVFNGEKAFSSTNGAGKTGYSHTYKRTLPYAKMNSKLVKDINVRAKTIKLLGKNGESFMTFKMVISCIDVKITDNKVKVDKLDYIKIKFFSILKDKTNCELQPMEWEKIFSNDIYGKELISTIDEKNLN